MRAEDRISGIERVLDAMRERGHDWIEIDSSYLDDGGVDRTARVARLCERASAGAGAGVARSFAVVGSSQRSHMDDGPADPGVMRVCGRQYSLALLALLDALAAEPTGSPLATSTSFDDVRATAFLVAGEAGRPYPDPSLIDRAVRLADRRLAELRVPLRATGYLAARDALGRLVAPLLEARLSGGP